MSVHTGNLAGIGDAQPQNASMPVEKCTDGFVDVTVEWVTAGLKFQ